MMYVWICKKCNKVIHSKPPIETFRDGTRARICPNCGTKDIEQIEVSSDEDLLTVTELADLTGYSKDWIYQLVRDGKVPFYRVYGKALFKLKDFKHEVKRGGEI